jgi:hypothetical protein
MQFSKHLTIILKEMCKRVKAPFTKVKFNTPDWYLGYTWTGKQQDEFSEWMVDYLYNNTEARKEIMAYPHKAKYKIREAVNWFIFNYGWRQKE